MSATRTKGDLAEMKVAADLLQRGYRVAFPFGDSWRYDLILCRDDDRFERVQVKYGNSTGVVMEINCHSQPARGTRRHLYTSGMIDWLAVYDVATDTCYYVPAAMLGEQGRSTMRLRMAESRNGQAKGLRWARDFVTI